MSPAVISITIVAYFIILFTISYIAGHKAVNEGFFVGNRKSAWYIVAFVLVPLFYRMNLVSIYEYLENRFRTSSYKTGSWFFFISKMLGAAVRLFLVCLTLQLLIFEPFHLPFLLNVMLTVFIVWLYTFRGGVKSLIWELKQRIRQQEGLLGTFQQKIEQLFQKQVLSWELAKENFRALEQYRKQTKQVNGKINDKYVQAQLFFNPKRILSTTAQTDAASIHSRSCFLCQANCPQEQEFFSSRTF